MQKKQRSFNELRPDEVKEFDYAHLGLNLREVDFDKLRQPFRDYYSVDNYMDVLHVIRDPKNFSFTCKYIMNRELSVFQLVWLNQLWKYSFPMLIASRGASKTWMTAMYYLLRMLITQGCKIVITSASFRQAKFVFEYMETIWFDAPILRDLAGHTSGPHRSNDVWTFKLGSSTAIAIPLGTGDKVRGLRANYLDIEEFSSVPEEIFEVILRGFTSTSSNPIENIKLMAKIRKMKEQNLWTPEAEKKVLATHKPNQILISGTAGYSFEHFAKYWKRYRDIIHSRGDINRLAEIFGEMPERGFDYKDYCIIRMPIELIPEGMMDDKAISNARATMDKGRFNMEFGACFTKDSAGFFPRSLVESCTTRQPIYVGNESVQFSHRIHGDLSSKYVFGVDPASESDNFAIVILEVCKTHLRVVYCWTTTRERLQKRLAAKAVKNNNFYAYVAQKIRQLMQVFPCEYIALDSQGGGLQVMEQLHDLRHLEENELPIWPIRQDNTHIWPGTKDYGYDDESGLHIIEMVSMAKNDYVVEANHGLKKDLENKVLLFPLIDGVSLSLAEVSDEQQDLIYDTLADCIKEVEDLKEELSAIVHVTTMNGTDRWQTPEIILPGNKRSRMRKDRYSALMMANAIGRRLLKQTTINYSEKVVGGFADSYKQYKPSPKDRMYNGPDWFTTPANKSCLGVGVTRGNYQDGSRGNVY